MITDITELALREKFEAWAEERCALPWGYLKKHRISDDTYSEPDFTDMWVAWKTSRVELVEALESAQREHVGIIKNHSEHAVRLINERDEFRNRAEAAEAELKLRDAAKPYAWERINCAECDQLVTKHSEVAQNWLDKGWDVRPLFTFGDADPELIALRAELKRRDEQEPVAWIAADALKIPRLAGIRAVTIPYVPEFPFSLYAAAPAVVNSPVILDGWKLVPIEPTENMVINGFESEPDEFFSDEKAWEAYEAMSGCGQAAERARLCWAAMLAAAPASEAK